MASNSKSSVRLNDQESAVVETGLSPPSNMGNRTPHGFSHDHRRSSNVLPAVPTLFSESHSQDIPQENRILLIKEQRSLLRDNRLFPKRGEAELPRDAPLIPKRSASTDRESLNASEHTPLLRNPSSSSQEPVTETEQVCEVWEDAIEAGLVTTTWRREAKVLAKYSAPLILSYVLQFSISVASVFALGHLGKLELGAASLASMTASITGYSVYYGLATSLDTLCAQAYGSGQKHLVGILVQRMICFLTLTSIPIAIVWYNGAYILSLIVPEVETAELAGQYLRILILGMPGYYMFESGKRFVQAQGLFNANLYCLLVCAPLNAFLQWFLVWHLGWGFIGAPIAMVIIETLLPLCLLSYVLLVDGRQCWGGFSRAALRNWLPMVTLALPSLVMVVAEFLAFEVLTLAAARLSPTHLAAQTVVATIATITYQLPFPLGIAASTRVANLIGATLVPAAQTAARVAYAAALGLGIINSIALTAGRYAIPALFTNDKDVAELVSYTLPLAAAFQLFDAISCVSNGILRGLGRQDVGGIISLCVYYVVGLPISFGLCFGAHAGLRGLWAGPAIALVLGGLIAASFIVSTNWQRSVDDAQKRNAIG